MKLLSISAKGLPLFKEELHITFFAGQRVSEADRSQLHLLRKGSSYYLNNAISLIGINASGKTVNVTAIEIYKLISDKGIFSGSGLLNPRVLLSDSLSSVTFLI